MLTEKLKKNYEFSKVFTKGKRQVGRELSIFYKKNNLTYNRLGYTTIKKYGNAVSRNKMRRLLREAYRSIAPKVTPGYDLILIGRGNIKINNFYTIRNNLENLLEKANLLEGK